MNRKLFDSAELLDHDKVAHLDEIFWIQSHDGDLPGCPANDSLR